MGALPAFFIAANGIAEEGGPFGRWANLSDVRAGGISVTGIGAVFAGLLLLFGFMTLLSWFLHGRKQAAEEDDNPEPEPIGAEKPLLQPDDEPFTLPETPLHMVPSSMIGAAALALHLYDRGALALGEARGLETDGIPRTVTLLAVGTMNRARVDGEEIVFARTRIAPDEAA